MISDTPPPIEAIVVRAATLPPSPADAAFSIVTLDRDTLEGQRLDQALETVPGVSLFRRTSSLGANPTTQGVSLRGIAGSGAGRALVTLDGVPQGDPFGGWVIWTRLPSEDIGSATVVRGAGAGPYGAGALTGVVALREAEAPVGSWSLDAAGGTLGTGRGALTMTLPVGSGSLFIVAAGEHSDGWVPVNQGRGAADQRLTLSDRSLSARYQVDTGGITEAVRVSAYQEDRGSGLIGATARDRGGSLSVSAARPPTATTPGWRAQTWLLASDLSNTSVSVAAGRTSTALSNNQYETPALGYGVNGAVRALPDWGSVELGFDLRGAVGEDRETFRPVAGVLTRRRLAGGQTLTGGVYGEAAFRRGPWLITGNTRVDGWSTFDGHRFESVIATGFQSVSLRPSSRGGVLPSGRLGARYDLGDGQWLRLAGYTGFRAPTLNELFRPFRVGNIVTEANSALTPERLYGVEGGGGGAFGRASWRVTAFYNRLDNPVTNFTVAKGPFTDPVAGVIPAGGLLLQRRNVGSIDAYGLEAEGRLSVARALTASLAVNWTHARVDGGKDAPALTGRLPAETPPVTLTGSLSWRPVDAITVSAETRYEGVRFDDDQNTRRLAPAATVDLKLQWRASRRLTAFVSAANVGDVAVATGQTADGVYSYAPPLTVLAGFTLSGFR